MEISKELLRDAKGVFVDTWGWIALGYYHDPHHEEVKCIYQELRQRQIPIYTSEYSVLKPRHDYASIVPIYRGQRDTERQNLFTS